MQNEDRAKVLKETIRKYIQDRRDFMDKLRNRNNDLVMPTLESIQLTISLCDIGEVGHLAIEEIKEMLLDDDNHLSHVARLALKSMGQSAAPAIPELFEIMSKWGVNEYPYQTGEILITLIENHPEILTFLIEQINSDCEKLVQAIIHTFCLLGDRAGIVYPDLIRIATNASDDTKGFAIRALGETGKQDDILCDLLLEYTQHSEWYIRGYAIGSIGKLKLYPSRYLPVIVDALYDDEGHDWTVREAAMIALGNYGKDAAVVIPQLKEFRRLLKTEEDSDESVRKLNQTLGKIKGIFPSS
jgi:HEAT repeats